MSVTCRKEIQGEGTLVCLSGEIDESAVLRGIFSASTRRILMDISGVSRINSCGIREWLNAIGEIPPGSQVEFIRCPRPMIKQFNLISNFAGGGKVVSFFAPYFCERCKREENILLSVSEQLESLLALNAPSFRCENCGETLVFDDLEERYFAFARRQAEGLPAV